MFTWGALARRSPSEIARIAAAAVSSRWCWRRPPWPCLASLLLPAGSLTTMAPPRALRSKSEGRTFTRPSRTARRNSRTSWPPSLNPIPRTVRSHPGMAAASSDCLNSRFTVAVAGNDTRRPKAVKRQLKELANVNDSLARRDKLAA